MSGRVRFNPLDVGFLFDPYPTYQRLRAEAPVHWSVTGSWVLTRHDDIKAVLTDERFRTVDTPERIAFRGQQFDRSGPNLDHLNQFLRGVFIFADPPVHGRLTKVARAGFSSMGPERMAAVIAQVIDELIDSLATRSTADLVADFAEPLACRTIGRLMGVPDEDASRLQKCSHKIGLVLDSMRPLEDYRAMNDAAGELLVYFERELQRNGTDDSFLGRMQAAAIANDATEDLVAITASVFFAGQETTINAASNAIYLLARHDAFRSQVMAETTSGMNWVHELLRFESPVQLTAREATVDVQVGEQTIKAGQRVVLYLGAANRDPAVFQEPDTLDFNRDPRAHLAFSAGLHRCIGAHLATEELRQSLPALFKRFPRLCPVHAQPRWRKNFTIRGHVELPVELNPASAHTP